MRRALVVAAAILASGCLGGPLVGKPSPAFSVVTNDGLVANETTFLGRFLVLDLMASWCQPCKLEVAHLREVQERIGGEVQILSISVEPFDTIEDLDAFGAEWGATWPYAIDRRGEVFDAMEMRSIPKLVVIDPAGTVVFEAQGEVPADTILRAISDAR